MFLVKSVFIEIELKNIGSVPCGGGPNSGRSGGCGYGYRGYCGLLDDENDAPRQHPTIVGYASLLAQMKQLIEVIVF